MANSDNFFQARYWKFVARMDTMCPVIFVQVADFYEFNQVWVKLINHYEKPNRNGQKKS